VGVRNEGVRDTQQLARRHRRQIAQVKQQRPALEQELDQQAGILVRRVDQLGVQERSQRRVSRRRVAVGA